MRALLIAVVLVPTAAAAEPGPVAYVAGGITRSDDGFTNTAGRLQAGARLGSLPIYGRVAAAYGEAVDHITSGPYRDLAAGLEGRLCSPGIARCMFAGVDLGQQRTEWSNMYNSGVNSGMAVTPRMGVELGGEHLRAGLEVGMRIWSYDSERADGSLYSERMMSMVLSSDVRYAF